MSSFSDCSFFCGGLPGSERDRLEAMIHAYGGMVAEVLTDNVDFVVDTHTGGSGAALVKRRKSKAKLVNPLFVSACINEGALVSASKFKLTSQAVAVPPPPVAPPSKMPKKEAASLSSKKRELEEDASSAMVDVLPVAATASSLKKTKVPVDELGPKDCHVIVDDSGFV